MVNPAAQEGGGSRPAWEIWSAGRRHYVLAALCFVALFNFIDRQVITILIEPIRSEFGASDAQMGLLTGLFFAGFYIVASVPLARLSDRGSRRNVIAACLGIWSATTMLGGFAMNFTQLAITRMGTAVAEGGAGPASHSMIADLYPLRRRATALALYAGVSSLGIGLGVLIGGSLSQAFSWRSVLIMVGAPGLLLALLMRLSVQEPPRAAIAAGSVANTPSLRETLASLWKRRSYRAIVLTVAFASLAGYGTLGWGPTYFLRVHGLTPAEVGLWFGLVSASALFIGGTASGLLSDWAGRYDMRWYMRIAAFGPLASIPFGLWFAFSESPRNALIALFMMFALLSMHSPPSYAISQTLAPPRTRAVASVMMGMFTTIAGMGIAPVIIGVCNDLLSPRFGVESIRYSLAFMLLGSAAATITALWSGRHIREDYAAIHEQPERP